MPEFEKQGAHWIFSRLNASLVAMLIAMLVAGIAGNALLDGYPGLAALVVAGVAATILLGIAIDKFLKAFSAYREKCGIKRCLHRLIAEEREELAIWMQLGALTGTVHPKSIGARGLLEHRILKKTGVTMPSEMFVKMEYWVFHYIKRHPELLDDARDLR